MTTGAADDMVLLFEWHVGLHVRRGFDDRDTGEVRTRLGANSCFGPQRSRR